MRIISRFKVVAAVLVTVVVLLANAWLLQTTLWRLLDASTWVRQTLDVRLNLSDILAQLINAETGQRGYLLTGEQRYLEPYHRATFGVEQSLEVLRALLQDNFAQVERLGQMDALVQEKLEELATTIEVHANHGDEAARQLVLDDRGKSIMDSIRGAVREMQDTEMALLAEREIAYASAQRNVTVASIGFAVKVLVLIAVLFYFMRREIANRNASTVQIAEYARSLDDSLKELRIERNEIAQLNEASAFLQSCNTLEEVSLLIRGFMQRMFPHHHGGIFTYAASRNQLDRFVHWGARLSGPDHMTPNDCWALRRGQDYFRVTGAATPVCRHLSDAAATASGNERHKVDVDSFCVPLVAHGETLGLLVLVLADPEQQLTQARRDEVQTSAHRLSDFLSRQLGLTLANLKLRESLNEQSIRDPLTNAFNRRYLEVVARTELAQARRSDRPLGVVMLDIDHFKRFNDVHGHLAGDAALVGVATFIQRNIRESDWLFRYGGEEFLLLLRDVDAVEMEHRLNELRHGVANVQLQHGDTVLPHVTMSMGAAVFPTDVDEAVAGTNPEVVLDRLIQLADGALYTAKNSGRNQVRIAGVESVPLALAAMPAADREPAPQA